MKKEFTEQSEMKVIGLTIRTNNTNELNPDTTKIGPTAGRYFADNVATSISNRKYPGVTIAGYTEYDGDEHQDYTYFIGEEVNSFEDTPEGLTAITIPANQYQKFTTNPGAMPEVVINAWQFIWQLSPEELGGSRNFKTDFEVYDQSKLGIGFGHDLSTGLYAPSNGGRPIELNRASLISFTELLGAIENRNHPKVNEFSILYKDTLLDNV